MIDHIIFKADSYNNVTIGDNPASYEKNCCEAFDVWLEKRRNVVFKDTPSLAKIINSHKKMIEQGKEGVEIAITQGYGHKDEVVARFLEMEKASKELFDSVDSLVKQVETQAH